MFKLNLLKIRTRSHLRKNKIIRKSVPYTQAKTIGVIFTVEDRKKHITIKNFVDSLEQDGKKVFVLALLPRNKENYDLLFDFFSINDLTFGGTIRSEKVDHFCKLPFDFLFCMDIQPNSLIQHILARSNAHCRIGKFEESDSVFFEMMIDSSNYTIELIESMHNYIKKIK